MSKEYKILISTLAIIFSLLATGIGYGFVSSSDLLFPQRLFCNGVFITQFVATAWCVIALFRKTKEH